MKYEMILQLTDEEMEWFQEVVNNLYSRVNTSTPELKGNTLLIRKGINGEYDIRNDGERILFTSLTKLLKEFPEHKREIIKQFL